MKKNIIIHIQHNFNKNYFYLLIKLIYFLHKMSFIPGNNIIAALDLERSQIKHFNNL